MLWCSVEPVARNRRTAPTLQPAPGEVERAEPDTELHCPPVLRPDVVTTRLRHPPSLKLRRTGGYGGQAGDSERRRGGAQRHPPPPLGLSKAHIPAGATTQGKRDLLPWGQPDPGAPPWGCGGRKGQ
jgi:hypothetical protein